MSGPSGFTCPSGEIAPACVDYFDPNEKTITPSGYDKVDEFSLCTLEGTRLLIIYSADTKCNGLGSGVTAALKFRLWLDGAAANGLDPIAHLTHTTNNDWRRVSFNLFPTMGLFRPHTIQVEAKVDQGQATIKNRLLSILEVRGCSAMSYYSLPLRMATPARQQPPSPSGGSGKGNKKGRGKGTDKNSSKKKR
jgi:hypothetical protein